MIELCLLFILFLLTTLARYLIFGAFEPIMFSMIFLFPVAALAIFIISKRLAEKERSYQPQNIPDWSFYHIQKSLMDIPENRPECLVASIVHSYYFKNK